MTRNRTYALTGISVIFYVLLCWIFADGLFSGNWWNSDAIATSNIFTYVFIALIVVAGVYQAHQLPDPIEIRFPEIPNPAVGQIEDPTSWKLIMGNVFYSIIWLPMRFFVGREWVTAGEAKLRSDAWMKGGTALQGFWTSAVAVPPTGHAAITYDWFRRFIQYMLDHEWYTWFAKVIAVGETLVGLGLIFGALVGVAAFFGTLLNFDFELAGSASSNPVLFGLGVFMVIGWKVAGWWGFDRWLLRTIGTPWARGHRFTDNANLGAGNPPPEVDASH